MHHSRAHGLPSERLVPIGLKVAVLALRPTLLQLGRAELLRSPEKGGHERA